MELRITVATEATEYDENLCRTGQN